MTPPLFVTAAAAVFSRRLYFSEIKNLKRGQGLRTRFSFRLFTTISRPLNVLLLISKVKIQQNRPVSAVSRFEKN
jgi:hypothetical protein